MAFINGNNPFEEYGKRIANTIQTGMKATMEPKPIAPTIPQAPTPPVAPQNPAIQPQGLQPVEPISQAGQIYKQRVTQNLLNPNPLAQSAQAQADTNMSRRNYLTQKQTQETMAQSPFGAGTRQYQRALMEGQAGANTANLGEQNQVNAYTRGLSDQAMERAQGLEDTEFARAIGERGYQDQQGSRYSALIQDTKGRQAYNRLVAGGMNPSVALQQVLEEGGTIKEGYRGMDNMQQLQSEAGDWVEATQGLKPTDKGYQEAVKARMIALDKATQQPLTDADTGRQTKDIQKKMRLGHSLSQTEIETALENNLIPQKNLSTIPRGATAVQAYLQENPSGLMNINGEVYTVVSGSNPTTSYEAGLFGDQKPRTTSVVELKTPEGETKYFYDGKFHDAMPAHPGSKIDEWGRDLNPFK
jgi:hypothetical protein